MNKDVRVEAGVNGTVVVMSAWCSRCRQQSGPNRDGACTFCGTRIVDEDSLPVKEMLAQLGQRDRSGRGLEETSAAHSVGPDGAGVSSSPTVATLPEQTPRRRRGGSKAYWTPETVIAAIQAWAAEHDGQPPTSMDWPRTGPDRAWPNFAAAVRVFGSWNRAIAAAGFDPVSHGQRRSGREPKAGSAPPEPKLGRSDPPASEPELAPDPSRPELLPDGTRRTSPLLLVTPEAMAPFQRSLLLALIAGMRAAADTLEQETAA